MEIRLSEGWRVALLIVLGALSLVVASWVLIQPSGVFGSTDPRLDVRRSMTTAVVDYDLPQLVGPTVITVQTSAGAKAVPIEVYRSEDTSGKVFFDVPASGPVVVSVTAVDQDGAVVYRAERSI